MENLTKKANELFIKGLYSEASSEYRAIQEKYPEISSFYKINLALCEKYAISREADNRPAIYVTLTTIHERLEKLRPVIDSLHNQQLPPEKILINVSADPYLLDKGITASNPLLKEISKLPLVEINWTNNTGPYRKIMPFLEKHYESGLIEDKVFITVDDDTIYPEYFIKSLYEKYSENDCIVAFRGRHITLKDEKIDTYRNWALGKEISCMENLPTGKDGIIYNTKFFTEDFLDFETAKDLAPTADDLWIKWHTGLNGVKSLILNPEAATSDYKSFPVVDYSSAYRDISLFKAHNSHESEGKNDLSVQRLESYFLEKYGYNLAALCSLLKEREQ